MNRAVFCYFPRVSQINAPMSKTFVLNSFHSYKCLRTTAW